MRENMARIVSVLTAPWRALERAPRIGLSKTELSGAGDEARTRYLNLGKVALYLVSYSRSADHRF